MNFNDIHTFLLSDGRRFSTLACAGHSIMHADPARPIWCVTDTSSGMTYTPLEAISAYRDNRQDSQEWAVIANPVKGYLDAMTKTASSYSQRILH